jgi:hypothetical protein
LLPGLPLHFWNVAALEAIGNSLGNFISVYASTLSAPSRKLGRILVEMDVHSGLSKLLEIDWRGRRYIQRLDYLGIPFRCSICHRTGHLQRTWPGRREEEVSEDTALHRDLVDTEDDVDIANNNVWTPSLEATTPSEQPFFSHE